MSASEKLKALGSQAEAGGGWDGWDSGPYPVAMFPLFNALPQIVAVVEAIPIEKWRPLMEQDIMDLIEVEDMGRLLDALAALDEALS